MEIFVSEILRLAGDAGGLKASIICHLEPELLTTFPAAFGAIFHYVCGKLEFSLHND